METIGIIGGGQLGRMLTFAAKRMGYNVIILDPDEHSPAGQVADEHIVAAFDDKNAIGELGMRSDVVTFEFENVSLESVEYLEEMRYKVTPSSRVLAITQNRILEKNFIRECGIATADFDEIERVDDFGRAAMTVGFPAVLKTVRGGYDGKGQWRANNLDDAKSAFAMSKGVRLIFERLIPFARELSVIATRDSKGDIVCYPVAENVHDGGVLASTVAPARIEKHIALRAQQMAATIGNKLGIVGTYCVEYFLTHDEELLVNEIAPRPHNSGHYTIDATQCSQFEQHIRAICDLPLAQPHLLAGAVMINILGQGRGDKLGGIAALLSNPAIVLHLYGKKHAAVRRKMGHYTMLTTDPVDEAAVTRAKNSLNRLKWTPDIPSFGKIGARGG
jgi:5-(carboxyamino)imidazole ribonucleotide synthase